MSRSSTNPLRDPEGYLAAQKFSRKIVCSRTGLPVSFADLGEEDGVPVLWVLPSGCSRWVAAAQDPLARLYGIRLIVIDRPGCGATPPVPLTDRIQLSGDMAVSVLEHLQVRPEHLIVNSAGIYYALDLLIRHPTIFASSLSPPPYVYMISPWSPLLPSDHPDYYPSYFTWIPSPIIATQHITLPQLAKIAENSSQLWSSSTKALWSGFSAAKTLFSSTLKDLTAPQPGYHNPPTLSISTTSGTASPIAPSASYAATPSRKPSLKLLRRSSSSKSVIADRVSSDASSVIALPPTPDLASQDHGDPHGVARLPMPSGVEGAEVKGNAAPMAVPRSGDSDSPLTRAGREENEEDEQEIVFEGDGLWGKLPCCIGCTTTEYMQAETFSGIGQEHLICLNRGPVDTGYRHIEQAVEELAQRLSQRDKAGADGHARKKLDVRIWWGWRDTMVPRRGQIWFNRNIGRFPDVIDVKVRDVVDGDHTDLLSRAEGIYEVYALIRARHRGEPDPEIEDDT